MYTGNCKVMQSNGCCLLSEDGWARINCSIASLMVCRTSVVSDVLRLYRQICRQVVDLAGLHMDSP
jgi:hypothetical protein